MAECMHSWRMACATLLILLGTNQAIAGTEIPPDSTLAGRYVAAWVSNNMTGQVEMLAEDAVFEDPMGTTQGKQAIHEAWQRQKIRINNFVRTTGYPSGQATFVYSGTVSFEQEFKTTSGEAMTLQFALDCTIAITVREGKVVRHVDYVDTEEFMKQLEAQVAELRRQERTPKGGKP